VIVGAMLVEPEDRTCAAGVSFFNNVGCIGMCGHGTIGHVVPTNTGRAFVNAEVTLLLDEQDPNCWGIRVSPTAFSS
jgi:proline racemase